MNYNLLRTIINIALLVLVICFFSFSYPLSSSNFRAYIKKRKKVFVSCFIGYLMLSTAISIIPFENLFISFSTVESAFEYACPDLTLGRILQNDQGAVALSEGKDGTTTVSFTKADKGWKLHVPFFHGVNSNFITYDDTLIYAVNCGDQVVIMVEDRTINIFSNGEKQEREAFIQQISDNLNSHFTHEKIYSKTYEGDLYYAFIDQPIDHYSIYINGEEISIF